jgi:hypothetical protein
MKIFVDWPWSSDVRRYGVPARAYIHTKGWLITIGLFPWVRGQVWTGAEGWTGRMRWITWAPTFKYHRPEACNVGTLPSGFSDSSGGNVNVVWGD